MANNKLRNKAEHLLREADVTIGGDRPWDIQVHNENLYTRALGGGSLALGESYMDGWWDCERLDEFFYRVFSAGLHARVLTVVDLVHVLKSRVMNVQKKSRAYEIGERHYDIGNDLYEAMLDKRMIYSCGYWKDARSLDDAQEDKLDLVCRKLSLRPGMRVLDIGCGWGGMAKFAAEHYGAQVVGITVSQEQAEYARSLCEKLPVDVRLQDYRDLDETFDRVISIGMFEHVGYKNYQSFMKVVRRSLKPDGLFLLQTIGRNSPVRSGDPWIERYIFPNSMLPCLSQTCGAFEGLFVLEDLHNFSADYDKTLMHWFNRFQTSWETLKGRYDDRFRRMWAYYLMASAGGFRARKNQLWQFVLSPKGVEGGYESLR